MTSQDDSSQSVPGNGLLASRVFAIPELLEPILLLLPPEDILISQRVAKPWKCTIDGSKRLRQSLFVEPIAPQTAWIAKKSINDEPYDGPNTFKSGRYIITQISMQSLPEHQIAMDALPQIQTEATRTPIHVKLNTLIHQRGHWKHMTLDDRIERGEGLRLGRTKKKILGYGRQMFLTQPPCKEVFVWIDWGQPQRIFNEDGVRFWQVLEITEQAGTVLYLPHIFMLAKDVLALTEDEEVMVVRELAKAKQRDEQCQLDREVVVEASGDLSMTQQPAQAVSAEWNWVSGTVRRWIGW